LTGAIPAELGASSNRLHSSIFSTRKGLINTFKILDVRNNKIVGSIPSTLGLMTSLTVIHLSDNQITGSLPSEIGNLLDLELLSLGA